MIITQRTQRNNAKNATAFATFASKVSATFALKTCHRDFRIAESRGAATQVAHSPSEPTGHDAAFHFYLSTLLHGQQLLSLGHRFVTAALDDNGEDCDIGWVHARYAACLCERFGTEFLQLLTALITHS